MVAPLVLADTITLVSLYTTEVPAGKLAVREPAANDTVGGTETTWLLSAKTVIANPGGAGAFSEIEHVVVAGPLNADGEQVIPVMAGGAASVRRAVCDWPFKVAVKVTDTALLVVPAVAVNVAVDFPG